MKAAFISQYRAGLKMLREVIEKCPGNLWNDDTGGATYWRIVYHSLFYTALYLSESVETFFPWENHLPQYNQLGALDDDGKPIVLSTIYTKDALLVYLDLIYDNMEEAVNRTSEDDESGFPWIPMDKFELHMYNIRHLQHHTGQLVERLHRNGVKGINWVGKVK